MKPSKPFRAFALALAAGVLMSSCSLLQVKSEVAAKEINLDITLGAPPPPEQADRGEIALPTIEPIPIDIPDPFDDDIDEPPPPPPPPFCPPFPTAFGARKPSELDVNVSDIPERDNSPVAGSYLFRFTGNYNEDRAYDTVSLKFLESQLRDVETNELKFTIDDTDTNIKLHLHSVGQLRADDTPNPTPGLFLTAIEIPQKDRSLENRLKFEPAGEIKLLTYPIEEQATWTETKTDIAGKEPIAPDVLTPSVNQMRSVIHVGAREDVAVCEDISRAWKVNWDLRITGQYETVLSGLLWLDTGMGGWPVREDLVMSSEPLISGNFTSNLMKLDPTDYL